MAMFRNPDDHRTFLTVLMTYALDLVGFSIVFPVLAPLLLNRNLHFFDPSSGEAIRTTVLGLLFASFGLAQFIGAPIAGALADHFGRYRVFLGTIGLSIGGYLVLALGVYENSLAGLFAGRILTGFCSGNFALAQAAAADLTDESHRSQAFGTLLSVGGIGFIIGPWIGGKLANPMWLSGSGAFLFAAIAALVNFLMVFFFYLERIKPKSQRKELFQTFRDLRLVLHIRILRRILTAYLLFTIGWGFFLIFSPTYLVQKFSLGSDLIGDIYAYMSMIWFFTNLFLNKELAGKFSLRKLVLSGTFLASIGVALFLFPETLWPFWFVIPVGLTGGALAWVNLGSVLSVCASEDMQGRALGAGGAMWSLGQIIASLAAGPIAGWNLYAPLALGAVFIFLCFLYFFFFYKEEKPSRG